MPSIRQQILHHLDQAVQKEAARVGLDGQPGPTVLTPPKQPSHGDLTSPLCLALGRQLKIAPRQLAVTLVERLGNLGGLVDRIDVAGPGHLNFFVSRTAWLDALYSMLQAGEKVLRTDRGANRRILIEFVSANPTGPLHVAHGRGAVTGDVVANMLTCAGYKVDREYYINDLGHQTDVLARSVFYRYALRLGAAPEQPTEFYPGDYVDEVAAALVQQKGEQWLKQPEDVWLEPVRTFAISALLHRIKADLTNFGILFDSWVSERALCSTERLTELATRLGASGHTYREDDKVWFRSTSFGDDKDRVILREDGRPTYFLGDIAYHEHKYRRGYDQFINVFGADHGGYVARVKAGIEALGDSSSHLRVILIQMVSLSRGGEAVRMGKRLGTAVWLSDVIAEAGRDATRYMFLTRRADAQMDFDVDLATQKTLDNPVFYAQMGHARLAAIGRKAAQANIAEPAVTREGLEALLLDDEIHLIKLLDRGGDVVADAAEAAEPHALIYYIQEVISAFHSYYTRNKNTAKIISEDQKLTHARLLLCRALKTSLAALLRLAGVEAPDEMYLGQQENGGIET